MLTVPLIIFTECHSTNFMWFIQFILSYGPVTAVLEILFCFIRTCWQLLRKGLFGAKGKIFLFLTNPLWNPDRDLHFTLVGDAGIFWEGFSVLFLIYFLNQCKALNIWKLLAFSIRCRFKINFWFRGLGSDFRFLIDSNTKITLRWKVHVFCFLDFELSDCNKACFEICAIIPLIKNCYSS